MKQQLKNDQKNGIDKNAPVVTVPIVKPAPHNEDKVIKPSLEERIQRVEELRSLTMKRQRTVETLHNVRTFSFASDDSCILTLKDSKGQSFETSNTNLVNLLTGFLTTLLSDKVSSLDDEILEFKL